MQSGRLDSRLTIQRLAVSARTSMGAPSQDWADVCEIWANIRALRGDALFAAQQQQTEYEVEIEVYYRDDIAAAMRAVDQELGDIYEIKAVDTSQHRKGRLLLQCARGLTQG